MCESTTSMSLRSVRAMGGGSWFSLSVSLSLSISLYPSLSLSFSLSQTHVANSKHQIDIDLPADFFYDILSLRLQCVHISQKRITIRTCGRDGE